MGELSKPGMGLRQLLAIRNRLNRGMTITNLWFDTNSRELFFDMEGDTYRVNYDGDVYRRQDWKYVGDWR